MPLNINDKSVYDPGKIHEETFLPSTIENIDAALFEHIDKKLNIFSNSNKGWNKVPVIWVGSERSYQIKHHKELRDNDGVVILPVITIERGNFRKDVSRKGAIQADILPINDIKGGTITISRRIKQDKTANFQNARSKRIYKQENFRDRTANKTVYETITIPLPIYIEIDYKISFFAEFQQQINEMTTPFITRPGGVNYFVVFRNGHVYEVFLESEYTASNNLSNLGEEERKYETSIDLRVLGYLVGDDKNLEQPKIIRRESAVETKVPREYSIGADLNGYLKKNGLIRP